ncbi:MAG: hypothetical protein AVDCRST_MAG68-2732 [uncultured Gemmatimonadetes bacterium]|uniref:Uncharacterized protein n=1 Tax=uncultured Gemmatimonadota bacterium TaxID=203437 RepID=A0A6J4KX52_9BACT|nr:MAG: hypothetical protein AVDCRST_MAG68-2732 [uncultured Gemmatimonadota bacterium]
MGRKVPRLPARVKPGSPPRAGARRHERPTGSAWSVRGARAPLELRRTRGHLDRAPSFRPPLGEREQCPRGRPQTRAEEGRTGVRAPFHHQSKEDRPDQRTRRAPLQPALHHQRGTGRRAQALPRGEDVADRDRVVRGGGPQEEGVGRPAHQSARETLVRGLQAQAGSRPRLVLRPCAGMAGEKQDELREQAARSRGGRCLKGTGDRGPHLAFLAKRARAGSPARRAGALVG